MKTPRPRARNLEPLSPPSGKRPGGSLDNLFRRQLSTKEHCVVISSERKEELAQSDTAAGQGSGCQREGGKKVAVFADIEKYVRRVPFETASPSVVTLDGDVILHASLSPPRASRGTAFGETAASRPSPPPSPLSQARATACSGGVADSAIIASATSSGDVDERSTLRLAASCGTSSGSRLNTSSFAVFGGDSGGGPSELGADDDRRGAEGHAVASIIQPLQLRRSKRLRRRMFLDDDDADACDDPCDDGANGRARDLSGFGGGNGGVATCVAAAISNPCVSAVTAAERAVNSDGSPTLVAALGQIAVVASAVATHSPHCGSKLTVSGDSRGSLVNAVTITTAAASTGEELSAVAPMSPASTTPAMPPGWGSPAAVGSPASTTIPGAMGITPGGRRRPSLRDEEDDEQVGEAGPKRRRRRTEERIDLWIGCEACSRWHLATCAEYTYWRHRAFVCGDFGKICEGAGVKQLTVDPEEDELFLLGRAAQIEATGATSRLRRGKLARCTDDRHRCGGPHDGVLQSKSDGVIRCKECRSRMATASKVIGRCGTSLLAYFGPVGGGGAMTPSTPTASQPSASQTQQSIGSASEVDEDVEAAEGSEEPLQEKRVAIHELVAEPTICERGDASDQVGSLEGGGASDGEVGRSTNAKRDVASSCGEGGVAEDAWLGCDVCQRWYLVDERLHSHWQDIPFECKAIGEECGSEASETVLVSKGNAYNGTHSSRGCQGSSLRAKDVPLPAGCWDIYRARSVLESYRPEAAGRGLFVFAAPLEAAQKTVRVAAEELLRASFFCSAGDEARLSEIFGRAGADSDSSAFADQMWLLWEGGSSASNVVGAALLRRCCNFRLGPGRLQGGAVLEYVAVRREAGGKGFLLVSAAEEVSRLMGFVELFSACDAPGEVSASRASAAAAAHRRWGFEDYGSDTWRLSCLGDCLRGGEAIGLMAKVVTPLTRR
eukprot:TRINITY_DN38264_c0_g1_i1.p1 TRINITY_DN38264_c0_g1~~TRINITY_DN38264_c0_g1_i1.p1  ORF type:complete len:968 (+),score=185.92 TRINITY_DN38264_c0_g1_i1:51-2906(+)